MDQSTNIKKVPFVLVTGFIGSGKTSLLKYILEVGSEDFRIAIVQNEFAPGHVDSAELKDADIPFDLLEINNGSVFCACLLDDFINKLADFKQQFNPDIIFLEATGLADPIALAQILQSPEVADEIFLAGAWTVVDCLNFERSYQYIKQIRHQLQIADLILLNKTDLAEPSEMLKKTIRQWNPYAGMHNSYDGQSDCIQKELQKILNYASAYPAACGGVSEHKKNIQSIEDSLRLAARSFNWQNGTPTVPGKIEHKTTGEKSNSVIGSKPLLASSRADMGSCVIRSNREFSEQSIRSFYKENRQLIYRMKGYTKTESGQFLAIQGIFDKLEIKLIPNWWGPTELIIMGPGLKAGPITKALFAS